MPNFANAYQKLRTDKIEYALSQWLCHTMICPIQSSERNTSRGQGNFFVLFLKVEVEETAKYTTYTKTLNASGTHGKVQGFIRRRHEKSGCYSPKAATPKQVQFLQRSNEGNNILGPPLFVKSSTYKFYLLWVRGILSFLLNCNLFLF